MICNPVLQDCTNVTNPSAYTSSVLQTVFSIFMIVGVIYFIWHFTFACYHFMSTEGDSKKFEEAKQELTYAVIGLVVMFSVFAILRLIGLVFGIQGLDSLQITLPSL
ncbi:hypothetical protein A3K55_01540 [Candidatus Shapirobacteria bacterium RBG_13_44_7]|uniref:Uncharacterized protein n=1 Tax=Candidatus Shapirobacteria bacterium RBG_13_44_7 TaxID=1802149 RepID=A0A1F7SEW4_9BACT|nr:MAG: hypothetical protein A3K55_01540 [Candidatus Shapirobacteria bacterium RBG_13_44_7]